MQKSIFQIGACNLNPICQNKTALKLARSDSAMQEYPAFVIAVLTSPDHQLAIFNRDRQIFVSESCDG